MKAGNQNARPPGHTPRNGRVGYEVNDIIDIIPDCQLKEPDFCANNGIRPLGGEVVGVMGRASAEAVKVVGMRRYGPLWCEVRPGDAVEIVGLVDGELKWARCRVLAVRVGDGEIGELVLLATGPQCCEEPRGFVGGVCNSCGGVVQSED